MPIRPLFLAALLAVLTPGAFAQTAPPVPLLPIPVHELAHGFGFVEGPVWNPRGFYLFSDIPASTLFKVTPQGKVTVVRHPSGRSNGNTYDGERFVSCEQENRRVSRKNKSGAWETVADNYGGKRFNAPNDVAVGPDGSLYFSDPTYGMKPEDGQLGFQGLYRVGLDGKVRLLDKEWQQPNGLCFSRDFKRLYVNDSQAGTLWVYDVDGKGELSHKTLLDTIPKPGDPDGMKCDEAGHLFVAAPKGVREYSADGKLIGLIPVPQDPANLCFGGADGHTLFITARTAVYTAQLP